MNIIASLVASWAVSLFMFGFSMKVQPTWLEKIRTPWKQINTYAAIGSLLAGLVAVITWEHLDPPVFILITIASTVAAMSFVLIQASFTDYQARLVDRHCLWVAILIAGVLNAINVLKDGDKNLIFLYLVLTMASAALVVLPIVGASDGRAFLLVVLGAFPAIGRHYFIVGLVLFLVGIILYVAIFAVATTTKESGFKPGLILKKFLTNKSLPAVPFIIGPFVLLLLASPFL